MSTKIWFNLARSPDILARSSKVALFVGTILAIINQGDLILAGEFSRTMLLKIILSYLVPFSVSTYASVQATLKPQS